MIFMDLLQLHHVPVGVHGPLFEKHWFNSRQPGSWLLNLIFVLFDEMYKKKKKGSYAIGLTTCKRYTGRPQLRVKSRIDQICCPLTDCVVLILLCIPWFTSLHHSWPRSQLKKTSLNIWNQLSSLKWIAMPLIRSRSPKIMKNCPQRYWTIV